MVGIGHRLPDGRPVRVEAVAQHMVLAPPIPAGELHPADKRRVPGPQQSSYGGTALGGVMVGEGEQVQPGGADVLQQALRGVRPVGIYGVHVQIRFLKADSFHNYGAHSFFIHPIIPLASAQ